MKPVRSIEESAAAIINLYQSRETREGGPQSGTKPI